MRFQRILHPTDYTDTSHPALHYAADLAHDAGGDLVLLHVVDTLGMDNVPYGQVASPDQPAAYRRQLFDELRREAPGDPKVHVEYVLSEEDPVTAILRAAADFDCDLIVLGTHGVSRWKRLLVGSIAEQVVRQAACPVLVVKAPAPTKPLPAYVATALHPGRLRESGA
ncbi:MAG TPA: universal stress protein [Gemmataceae bacterium]|jgi:universal stress protein A